MQVRQIIQTILQQKELLCVLAYLYPRVNLDWKESKILFKVIWFRIYSSTSFTDTFYSKSKVLVDRKSATDTCCLQFDNGIVESTFQESMKTQ